MSKKLIHLLRHGSLFRDNDGANDFWRIKDYLENHFVFCHHWSDDKWKSSMAGGGGHKKRFQYCTDSSGTILYLRALQGHSGRNLIDSSLQDNVVIPDGFFKYIYLHKAWKKHQNTVYWVDIKLAQKKGLKFYQTRSNAIILYNTLPAYCIPKAVRMETGENHLRKVYESPRPPPKISLKHEWKRELGSEHAPPSSSGTFRTQSY